MLIYIVYGAQGEYDDHEEWDIKAFANWEKAEAFVGLLDAAKIDPRPGNRRALDSMNGNRWNYDVEFGIFELEYVR